MALKAELEQWHQAVELFDQQDYDSSLEIFKTIADSAKIHFNIGLILGRKGDHTTAIEAYSKALELDQYLVVAYFQRGVARMVMQQNAESLSDFNNALKYLRNNEFIDYTQIGLEYKVYTCEVLYNRALCFFCLGQEQDAQDDLTDAIRHAVEERHSWIKKAIESRGMDCPLYCVPKGVIYRPSASKLRSTKKIDFLGSARVIASADGRDNFTGFKGALVRKETLKNMSPGAMTRSETVKHMGAGPLAHKSMRVRRSSPPPDMGPGRGLARSNTVPAKYQEAGSLPNHPGSSSLAHEISSSVPPQGIRMQSADNFNERGDESDGTSESSAFSTPSATPMSGAPDGMSPDDTSPGTPKSAMKKPAKNGAVDPLDIIRAGLARRTTLKNQQRQQQMGGARAQLPQRAGTMKHTPSHGGLSNGDSDSGKSQLAGQLRSNLGNGLRSAGSSPAPQRATAQFARTEVIMPVIQQSNTENSGNTSSEYPSAHVSPEYGDSSSAEQHSLNHPVMMTPPLTHEELAARGVGATNISQGVVAPRPQPGTPAYPPSSSVSLSVSPASPAPLGPGGSGSSAAQYSSLAGSMVGGGGLRRAPTKKDSMKVKVHFGDDIINLMVPKLAAFETLRAKISAKIANAVASGQPSRAALRIQYLDEDGEAVLMTDEDDFELAKAYAGGDMSAPETNTVERLELWCSV
ncbi:hypothetical protein COEREDRAFT_80618 [Coemansia reversa NRRL 1564]|uniref:PB1 domain-containing protein n=1 Tax=Coemansia reversa (strain ATCC 12441 / NRRL 1564) TaxID=763665 RepID=A0A2G5BE37_COERN|nr:hypothetical protein COEREDRAFT_80618 [Coemansia reversa NRRL 1564]|eukprot:PIA17278.1 hypothetical protein COEREDRAFT_80618 [Coemansia reversa NRRL 1564]